LKENLFSSKAGTYDLLTLVIVYMHLILIANIFLLLLLFLTLIFINPGGSKNSLLKFNKTIYYKNIDDFIGIFICKI